ncbi:MAG TPA: prepilin-type N-terminal cleavage/methylation domain-containing protein [Sumerlaeia bacterium]|nr:prepilin-type N-terminal cleavage/methylation domain-containing protein [Sumerlaeia bacterium]
MSMSKSNHRATGFTLIELLIVVAIIAILAAIAVPNFLEAQVRSKVSRVKSDLRTLANGMTAYFTDNGAYPLDWDSGQYGPYGRQSEWKTYASLTTPISYMSSIPRDPFCERLSMRILNAPKEDPYFQFAGGGKTGYFVMSTPGPDSLDDFLWADFWNVNLMYDTTNGTKSRGDLARSSYGAHPE